MYQTEKTFMRLLAISLAPGISFYGTVEVVMNEGDPSGWWIRSVMAYDRGAHREVRKDWAILVKGAIDRDLGLCDEITGRCIRELRLAKERDQTE